MYADDNPEVASLVAYRAGLRSQYAPDTDHRDIDKEAYEDARAFIDRELLGSTDAKAFFSEKHHSIEDVYAFFKQAKENHDTASNNGKVNRKWLSDCSSRIAYYGRIFDMLAQHHPEYVALAWGAFKFILQGILNYERLLQEFSEAITQIGDALCGIKVSAELYQTDDMRDAIARLYATILRFFTQAIAWYSRSRAKRAISAVLNPYELKYKDTVDQIRNCTRVINNLAEGKHWIEMRDMHINIELLHKEQQQLRETVDNTFKLVTCNKSISERIHIDIQDMLPRTRDIQLANILSALKPQICPHKNLKTIQSIVKRSRMIRIPEQEPKTVLHSLSRWLTKEGSSLFILRIGPRAEAKGRELTTDIVSMLQVKKLNVIWRLSSPNSSTEPFTEVLKSLIHQALLLDPMLLHPTDLNIALYESTHSEAEWTSLFQKIFSRLSKCYIIIEMHDLFEANRDNAAWMTSFLRVFQELARNAESQNHVLKFLVLCYGGVGGSESVEGIGDIEVLLRKPVVTPVRCKRMVAHRKGAKGWERVVPKL